MRRYRTGHETRSIALRYRLGLALGLLLAALFAAGTARADGTDPLSTLVKFNDRDYEISYSDSVSLDPVSSSTVTKIGYGHESQVRIVTTATGTYSTDGLVSPNVLYPGVNVRRVYKEIPFAIGVFARSEPGSSILSIGRSTVDGDIEINRIDDLGFRSCSTSGSFQSCHRTY